MNTTEKLARWTEKTAGDPEMQAELAALKRAGPGAVEEAFGAELAFGTGGLRGLMGAGTAKMNLYTVGKATQGLAAALRDKKERRPVVIAYDSRHNSALFARHAARVLAGNGVFVWLFKRLMPTPVLSFAVRHLKCGAGICITASHNPAPYNGYKVYGPDGGQLVPEAAADIAGHIAPLDPFDDVKLAGFEAAVELGAIRTVGEAVVEAYLDAVEAQSVLPAGRGIPLKVVYTPLNGAGIECVPAILGRIGLKGVQLVPEQATPDGNFPTCPSPNPENPDAMACGIELMQHSGADILLATDPDCDRVGVAVNHHGLVHRLTGNEVGVLLLDYLCAMRQLANTLPKNPVVVSTIVSTAMAGPLAERYGASLIRVLTGFKYIGQQVGILEKARKGQRFIFGFEESCGYLSGSYVRDKDGVAACMLVCEMARWYRGFGKTLVDVLEGLYREYGTYHSSLNSFEYPGVDGQKAMKTMMEKLRAAPPKRVTQVPVAKATDYLDAATAAQKGLPPANVLGYRLENGATIFVRPSGTEPKIKLYIETVADTHVAAEENNRQLCAGMRVLLGQKPEPKPGAWWRQAAQPAPGSKGEPWQSSNYLPPAKPTFGAAPL